VAIATLGIVQEVSFEQAFFAVLGGLQKQDWFVPNAGLTKVFVVSCYDASFLTSERRTEIGLWKPDLSIATSLMSGFTMSPCKKCATVLIR
jgi:hypothetical protein